MSVIKTIINDCPLTEALLLGPSLRSSWLTVENALDMLTYGLQLAAVHGYLFDREVLRSGSFSVAVAMQLVLLWTRLQRYIRYVVRHNSSAEAVYKSWRQSTVII